MTRKVTYAQAEAIRHRFARGGVTQTALAAEYGVTRANVSLIVKHSIHKHAPVQKGNAR